MAKTFWNNNELTKTKRYFKETILHFINYKGMFLRILAWIKCLFKYKLMNKQNYAQTIWILLHTYRYYPQYTAAAYPSSHASDKR